MFVRQSSILPNIRDFVRELATGPGDEILAASPLTFDPSIVDLFLALCSGASLVVLPRQQKLKPNLYDALFSANRVSIVQCTPGLLTRIFAGEWEPPACLKIVAVGGERCCAAGRVLQRLLANQVRVYHLYGLTEMSVWQSMVRIMEPSAAACPPIFFRAGNLLTETDISCESEGGGEVVVSSLTRHSCQQLSCACRPPFRIHTGDLAAWRGDHLFWQGRTDNVVKVQGTKVSLEQVETRLSESLSTQVVCMAAPGSMTVTAFVQTAEKLDGKIDVSELFERSRKILSNAEMPGRFLFVDQFPLSHHGKIDRKKLGLLGGLPANVPASVDSPGQLVSLLWNRFLGGAPGPADSFLAAGGDSFLAVALVNAVADAFPGQASGLLEALVSWRYETVIQMLEQGERDTDQPLQKRQKLAAEESAPYEGSEVVNVTTNTAVITKRDHQKTNSNAPWAIYRCKGRQNEARSLAGPKNSFEFRLEWKVDFEKCIDSSPLYVARQGRVEEAVVVVGSHSGWVKCVRCTSGHEVWAVRLVCMFVILPVLSLQ